MPEEVLFEFEAEQSRAHIASYLRTVADKLDAGEPISLESGSDVVTLDPPANAEFEVKAEREGPADGDGELSVEFEIEWPEGRTDDGLTIE